MERTVVVDTETTGVDARVDHVVEAAAVEVDWSGQGRHRTLLDTLVRPGVPIKATAMGVHHIDEATAARGRAFAGVRAELLAHGAGASVWAHKADFDRGMLRLGPPHPEEGPPWHDSLRLSRHAFPDAPDHQLQTLRYHLGLAAVDGARPHGALGDAWLVAELMVRCRAALGQADGTALRGRAATAVLLRRVGFGKHRGAPWSEVPADYLEWMLGPGQEWQADVEHTARHWLARARGQE